MRGSQSRRVLAIAEDVLTWAVAAAAKKEANSCGWFHSLTEGPSLPNFVNCSRFSKHKVCNSNSKEPRQCAYNEIYEYCSRYKTCGRVISKRGIQLAKPDVKTETSNAKHQCSMDITCNRPSLHSNCSKTKQPPRSTVMLQALPMAP